MALIARYLIDTSASARMRHSVAAGRLAPLIEARVVATCATLEAEALFCAPRARRGQADPRRPTPGVRTPGNRSTSLADGLRRAADPRPNWPTPRGGHRRPVTAVLASEHQ